MSLGLRYRINEGIIVSEDRGGHQESVEVIVRDITLFPEEVRVGFELRDDLNGNIKLNLGEDEKYDVTPCCTLHVPVNPLRRRGSPSEDRVFLKFYAPRTVDLSERRMYSL